MNSNGLTFSVKMVGLYLLSLFVMNSRTLLYLLNWFIFE